MKTLLKNAKVYTDGKFDANDICICDGKIVSIAASLLDDGADAVYDLDGCFVFPGLIDVHVHLREPGFLYKETIATGTGAAARGGYSAVCSMPNLKPVPDSKENLALQLEAIKKDAKIRVFPYGAISVGEMGEQLSDFDSIQADIIAFSDDGRGVQSEEMMLSAMELAKKYGKIIAAHCEDNSLLEGGYIHKGEYAKLHNHKGICSESEYLPIKRDIELARKSGCKYHVCHISCKESVELIRKAKKSGVDITCETAPHYLVFNDMDLKEDGRFKMNPPIRSEEDRKALIEGILDGTIDMIATDHAPHSAQEKSKGLAGSLMGVVGIETAFGVMYTHLVREGIVSLEDLVLLMSVNPAERFGIENSLEVGKNANLCVYNLSEKYTVNPDEFLSKGKFTPFEGMELYGKCMMTFSDGNLAWISGEINKI